MLRSALSIGATMVKKENYREISFDKLCDLLRREYKIVYIADTSFLIRVLISILKDEKDSSYYIRLLEKTKQSLLVVPHIVLEEIFKSTELPKKIAKLLKIDEVEAKRIIEKNLHAILKHTETHYKSFYILRSNKDIDQKLEKIAKMLKIVFRIRPTFVSPKDADIAAISVMIKKLAPKTLVVVLTENPKDFYGLTQIGIKIFCSIMDEEYVSF